MTRHLVILLVLVSFSFAFTDVALPYTALVIESGAGSPRITVYEGLTRPDPTLVASAGGGLVFDAVIEGFVSSGGAGIPAPPNHAIDYVVEMLTPARPGSDLSGSVDPSTGVFTGLNLAWADSPTTNARIHLLQYEFEPIGGLPIAFTGYGARSTPLAHGDTVVNLPVDLITPGTSVLNGLYTPVTTYGPIETRYQRREGVGLIAIGASFSDDGKEFKGRALLGVTDPDFITHIK